MPSFPRELRDSLAFMQGTPPCAIHMTSDMKDGIVEFKKDVGTQASDKGSQRIGDIQTTYNEDRGF